MARAAARLMARRPREIPACQFGCKNRPKPQGAPSGWQMPGGLSQKDRIGESCPPGGIMTPRRAASVAGQHSETIAGTAGRPNGLTPRA